MYLKLLQKSLIHNIVLIPQTGTYLKKVNEEKCKNKDSVKRVTKVEVYNELYTKRTVLEFFKVLKSETIIIQSDCVIQK